MPEPSIQGTRFMKRSRTTNRCEARTVIQGASTFLLQRGSPSRSLSRRLSEFVQRRNCVFQNYSEAFHFTRFTDL